MGIARASALREFSQELSLRAYSAGVLAAVRKCTHLIGRRMKIRKLRTAGTAPLSPAGETGITDVMSTGKGPTSGIIREPHLKHTVCHPSTWEAQTGLP